VPPVAATTTVAIDAIYAALADLPQRQAVNQLTRSVHAAAWVDTAGQIQLVREDVGRHNALDKLVGALAHEHLSAQTGMVLLTSRISVEMVQKAAVLDVPLVIAVSAPTALAVRTAESAGITLVAVARDDGFEIFTHPRRISRESAAHVA
jgi:FdhD protein